MRILSSYIRNLCIKLKKKKRKKVASIDDKSCLKRITSIDGTQLHHLIHAAYPSYWKKNFGYYS
jgi:hypothetical protein